MHAWKKLAVRVAAIGIGLGAVAIPASVAHATAPHGTTTPVVTITPDTNVKNNAAVKVSGSGYPASAETVYIVECGDTKGEQDCDLGTLAQGMTDDTGSFSNVSVTVHTGAVGNSSCKAGGKCFIAASTSASPTPPAADYGVGKFFFAGSSKASTKTTAKFVSKTDKVKGKVVSGGSGVKGLKAVLDIKAHGKWKKVDALKTGKGGKFASKKLTRSGKYEVKTKKQKSYGASHSKVIKVKV